MVQLGKKLKEQQNKISLSEKLMEKLRTKVEKSGNLETEIQELKTKLAEAEEKIKEAA